MGISKRKLPTIPASSRMVLVYAYGNRVTQQEFFNPHGTTADEVTDYVYDANDRLLIEDFYQGSTHAATTTYLYDFTQQVSLTKNAPSADPNFPDPNSQLKSVTYQYDLQGRMKSAVTLVTENATLSRTEVEYQYDSAGNRVLSISEYNPESNNPFSQPVRTRTEYLTEDSNPTGYSQVLQETQYEVDANGDIVAPAKKIVYAIGHDQISQTVFVWDAGSDDWDAGDTHYFGTDGHGSVRVLWDAVAAIVRDAAAGVGAQIYHFDAYGNLLNFAGAVTPITSYLYSGESFDFSLGQQYLRARWYDATTGRFNRLDPFFGNSRDPQSFHKYGYVHGDPIMGVDPSGKLFSSVLATVNSGLARLQNSGWIGSAVATFLRNQMPTYLMRHFGHAATQIQWTFIHRMFFGMATEFAHHALQHRTAPIAEAVEFLAIELESVKQSPTETIELFMQRKRNSEVLAGIARRWIEENRASVVDVVQSVFVPFTDSQMGMIYNMFLPPPTAVFDGDLTPRFVKKWRAVTNAMQYYPLLVGMLREFGRLETLSPEGNRAFEDAQIDYRNASLFDGIAFMNIWVRPREVARMINVLSNAIHNQNDLETASSDWKEVKHRMEKLGFLE